MWYLAFVCVSFSLTLMSCANRVALGGGPRDETPPVLDSIESFQNFQTQFRIQDIDLVFDEFINLRNPARQVVISPPLTYNPRIDGKGKKVSVRFHEEEVLKTNATYIINFGESITDYTEGNVLENFTLVFSTGDFIDSLHVAGRVKDAYTLDPKEDVLVMLYDTFEDSIVYKQRPFYFSRTGKDGDFIINNIRQDTFKVVVLRDLNLNYIYDPASEEIGFLDSLIVIKPERPLFLNLDIFKERGLPRYLGYNVLNQGKINIEFDQEVAPGWIRPIDSLNWVVTKPANINNIVLWYMPSNRNTIKVEIGETEKDTIQFRINTRTVRPLEGTPALERMNDNGRVGLHPEDTLLLQFDRPVASFDRERVTAVDTSSSDTLIATLTYHQQNPDQLRIVANWRPGIEVELNLFPGSVTDIFGTSNDTITRNFRVGESADFGTIKLDPQDLDSTVFFHLDLMQRDKVLKRAAVRSIDSPVLFEKLVPGEYTLRIIEDRNQNGKWDPGNYTRKVQSEKIFVLPLEKVRNNWLLELNIQTLIENARNDDPENE